MAADSIECELGYRSKIGVAQISLFGVGIVISGHYLNWSVGLEAGYYGFLSGTLLLASGFVALMLCLAEITSAVPFTGGLYGCVRLTLGPYLGFLVGFFEVLQNIFYNACIVAPLGHLLALIIGLDEMYEPLLWLLFFAVSIPINLLGGDWFWHTNTLVSSLAVVIVFVYLISTAPTSDFEKFAAQPQEDRFREALAHFPYSSWFFVGLEMIPLCCNDAHEPKKSVPRGILVATAVMIVFAVSLITSVSSNHPGLLAVSSEEYPLIPGLMQALDLDRRSAAALMVPALFASANAFVFLFGRQMKSLADSMLFPDVFHTTVGRNQAPVVSIIFGSLLSFVLMLIAHFFEKQIYLVLLGISAFGSAFIYMSVLYTYISFQKKFATLDRHFRNPLGVVASYYGMCVVLLSVACFLALEDAGVVVLAVFVGIVVLATLMYIFYARRRQRFSKDEQKVFFNAYVINANRGKAKAIKRKSMYMSGVTQDSVSFRSYRKNVVSGRRLSSDRGDGNESVKSFRSEDLMASKKMSIDDQDPAPTNEGYSNHSSKSLHNSSGHSLHMASDDIGDLPNTLFTITEEDRTRSMLSIGRDSSVMTFDPGMLTARSERPLMVQTDFTDEDAGHNGDIESGADNKDSCHLVTKKWKQSMAVVAAAKGFESSGMDRRSRLQLIDEESTQSDPNLVVQLDADADTAKPLASRSAYDHRPAPNLASLVQRVQEQDGSSSVTKANSKLFKKVGGSIIKSMKVLSTLNKVVTDDPLFAQYTESFVNSALEERYQDFQARNSPRKPHPQDLKKEAADDSNQLDIKKKLKPVSTPKQEPNSNSVAANTAASSPAPFGSPTRQYSFGSKGLKSLVSQVMQSNHLQDSATHKSSFDTASNLVYPLENKNSNSEKSEDGTTNLTSPTVLLSSLTSVDVEQAPPSRPKSPDDNTPPV